MRAKEKVLIIVGPTASGKSGLAVNLAQKFDGEVISADSRQVYKGLDIGTGKITKREMRGIPHHVLDVISPKKVFTAHDFVIHATETVGQVVCRGTLPIIAGGTGFYIDAFTGRIVLPDVAPNAKLRATLSKKTAAQLFAMLQKIDPARAKTIEAQNPVRLIRAIEIAKALGKVPTPSTEKSQYNFLWIGIQPPEKILRTKIHSRLIARIKKGMVKESQRLHESGLSYKRMEQLGLEYRSLARFLQKKITKEEMIEELERDINRYAKKQMMYWQRNKDIQWFSLSQKTKIEKVVKSWLKK